MVALSWFFFFFKQKTAYEIMPSLVGSEMCIRDSAARGRRPPDTALGAAAAALLRSCGTGVLVGRRALERRASRRPPGHRRLHGPLIVRGDAAPLSRLAASRLGRRRFHGCPARSTSLHGCSAPPRRPPLAPHHLEQRADLCAAYVVLLQSRAMRMCMQQLCLK